MTTHSMKIEIVDNPREAPTYSRERFKSVKIEKCIIVGKGTVEGNPTVDIQLKDNDGNNYVVMVTGSLIESLGAAIAGKRMRDFEEGQRENTHN